MGGQKKICDQKEFSCLYMELNEQLTTDTKPFLWILLVSWAGGSKLSDMTVKTAVENTTSQTMLPGS
jgi:hypothetical protein